MSGGMDRRCKVIPINVSSVIGSCTEVDFGPWAGGVLILPAGITATTLAVHVANGPGGTYVPLYNSAGQVFVNGATVAAQRAYSLPVETYPALMMKFVSNQAAVEALALLVKG